ncbi:MAG: hypothetical protein JO233_08365, partial [Candidatus Eremiobacteraeota bacterium]|nr:hypothetical protein [Candidatus Eremiobacteraeota bacterium]
GATPIQAALRNGDAQTGVSIILMDSGMDTGPLVLQEPIAIESDDNYGALHDRLANVGARLISHAIDLAAEENLGPRAQEGEPSVTRPLSKEDLTIDWFWPGMRIVNAVRSLSPEPAARAQIGNIHVKLLQVKQDDRTKDGARPGEMIDHDDMLAVACGDGVVQVEELIPASRSKMSGAQFKRWLKARAP